jgi:hypothetical protein
VGYKVRNKVLKLVFEDPEMDGLEVRARSLPLGVFMDRFAKVPTNVTDPRKLTAEERASSWDVISVFADVLVSWNLEDEHDQPIPATLAGLKTLELDFAMQILHAYMDAVGGVDAPLAGSSTAGETSVAGSIPMVPLSESRAS